MSILFARAAPPRTERRSEEVSQVEFAKMLMSGQSVAGVTVNADSAMRHDAVWSCITKKAQDVAMLPVDVVRYRGAERVEVDPQPQIIIKPSLWVTDPMDWRYQVLVSWFSSGRAWGNITATTPDHRYPTRIELVNDADVTVSQWGRELKIYVCGEERQLWPLGDLWYEPAFTVPGRFLGMSPIAYHATTIGVGIAAEKFGADFFAGGGHPTGIFQMDSDPGEPVAASLKQRLMAVMKGNRDPLVLPASVKYTQLQVNPGDSAFIESQKYTVEQICRIFDEDPADHGSSGGGTNLTYANRSDADLARYKRKQYWVTKLQNVLTSFIEPPQAVKINTSALLMMTAAERWKIWDLRLKNKTVSVNGVLAKEDEPKIEDADYDLPGIPGGNPAEPQKVEVIA